MTTSSGTRVGDASQGERRLAFADGLRAVAALWVVLFHLSEGHHINALRAALPGAVDAVVFDAGHFGVPIFFVLSGFVMAYTTRRAVFDGDYAWRFFARRLVRLSPPYYFAIAVMLGADIVKAVVDPGAGFPYPLGTVLANFAYVQGLLNLPELNTVFWTLGIEVQFYAIFALAQYLSCRLGGDGAAASARRLAVPGALALFCVADLAGWLGTDRHGSALPFLYAFVAGMFACWGGTVRFWVAPSALFIMVLLTLSLVLKSGFAAVVGVTAALLLVAGVKGAMGRWLAWGWLQRLAVVSYSLYLLHNPATGTVFRLVDRVGHSGVLFNLVGGALSVLVSVAVAALAYRWVERPAIAWSHRLSGATGARVPLARGSN